MKTYVFTIGDPRHPKRINGAVFAKGEKSALTMIRAEVLDRGLAPGVPIDVHLLSGDRGRIHIFDEPTK